jgi:hypothetical protein
LLKEGFVLVIPARNWSIGFGDREDKTTMKRVYQDRITGQQAHKEENEHGQ